MKLIYKIAGISLLGGVVAALVSGSAHTASWRQTPLAVANGKPHGRILIAVTEAEIEPGHRREFIKQTRRVLADLPNHDGLLGYTFRFEIFGNKAWTMTAWQDKSSRNRFVNYEAHKAATQAAGKLVKSMKSRSMSIPAPEIRIDWETAFEILRAVEIYRKPTGPTTESPQ